jgi:spermidine synthase
LLALSGLFLLLSGVAALTYQVVWVRLLGLSMGSTAAAVSTVLAAFFAGLAAGSALADRLTRDRSGIGPYLVLELGIGISGIALLPLLLRLDSLVAALPASLATAIATKFAITLLLLALPTLCMGATFPVMAALVSRGRSDLGGRLSFVYSMNTWGAVAGAALAGFVLIPQLGLDGAVLAAAACNFAIVAIGLVAHSAFADPVDRDRSSARSASATPTPDAGAHARPSGAESVRTSDEARRAAASAAFLALVATGFCSIAAEVGWTKYLAVFTGATLYGFSTILAVFLTGIALGSWVVRPFLGNTERSLRMLVGGLALLALAVALTRPALSLAPRVLAAGGVDAASLFAYAFIVVVLLPPTLILGGLFPVSLELYCAGAGHLRARAGRAYAFNTLAGIGGSIAAGFFVIPRAGTEALLVGLALTLAAVSAVVAIRSRPAFGPRGDRFRVSAVVAAAVVASVTLWLPPLDYRPLILAVATRDPSAAHTDPALWRFTFLRESHVGVVSVLTRDDLFGALQTNGLTESHLNFVDPTMSSPTESWLGLVPYLMHPEPLRAFVVGFGGGKTTLALAQTLDLEEIRVVELEPAIVEAVVASAGGAAPALMDPRVDLQLNDARNALLVDRSRYDIIVSQPSHPWLAGSGTLFTREFFEIVRSRLGPGGVFGQWLNLYNMDAVTLGAIMKSFYEAFPYGFSLRPAGGGDLLIFGSEWPISLDPLRIEKRLAHRELAVHLGRLGATRAEDFLRDFALSRTETLRAVQEGPSNTDTNLISEVRLARIGGGPLPGRDASTFLVETRRWDILPYLPPLRAPAVVDRLAEDLAARGRGADAEMVKALPVNRRLRE